MPVVTILKETNLVYNDTRYLIRVDGKFIEGFDTLEEAEKIATKIIENKGQLTTGEITIKEMIC